MYLQSRNRLTFTAKLYPYYLPAMAFFSLLHALRYLLSGSLKDTRYALDGYFAGLSSEFGPPKKMVEAGLAVARPERQHRPLRRTKLLLSCVYFIWMRFVSLILSLVGRTRPGRLTIFVLPLDSFGFCLRVSRPDGRPFSLGQCCAR